MSSNSQKGFTLLEIMIVLGIIGSLMALAIPKLSGNKNKIKTVVRQMGALSKEVRNQARIKKMTYRIVFQFGKPSKYWIEAAPENTLIPSKQTQESLQRLSDEERPKDPFQKVDKPIKERELDSGLSFKSIEVAGTDEPQEKDIAYIYYSSEGVVEKSIIQIKSERDQVWSLVIHPLTGQVSFIEKAVNLKELSLE